MPKFITKLDRTAHFAKSNCRFSLESRKGAHLKPPHWPTSLAKRLNLESAGQNRTHIDLRCLRCAIWWAGMPASAYAAAMPVAI